MTEQRRQLHDPAAEAGTLGAMLLSPDIALEVAEIVTADDFHHPANRTVFATIMRAVGANRPSDRTSITSALIDSGDINRVGGAGYILELTEACASALNGPFHARSVAAMAALRRIEVATAKVSHLLHQPGVVAEELAEVAQSEIYAATAGRNQSDVHVINDVIDDEFDHLEAVRNGTTAPGIPIGFRDFDALFKGWMPGRLIIPAGRPGMGKAVELSTPLPTPHGWTTMGEVQVGDYLIGADGNPVRVVATSEVLGDRPCYEVEFNDGSVIVADAWHEWSVTTRASRRQAAERKGVAFHWGATERAELRRMRDQIEAEPNRLMGTGELLSLIGSRFRKAVFAATGGLPADGRVSVPYLREGKQHSRSSAGWYSHGLIRRVVERVDRPVNSGNRVHHETILTTEQMAKSVRVGADQRLNYAVKVAEPMNLPDLDLPIGPYTLGAWAGDGDSSGAAFTTDDPEILLHIEAEGYEVRPHAAPLRYGIVLPDARVKRRSKTCLGCGATRTYHLASGWCAACIHAQPTFLGALRELGVLGDKHIPQQYLRASENQRRALLAGLLDTDGSVANDGQSVRFEVCSRRLAEDVQELILSLGYRCTMTTKQVPGRTAKSSTCYRLTFCPNQKVFRMARKASRQTLTQTSRATHRYIADIRPIPSVPVRCVSIDNEDHLYLAGRSMIPTHNSLISLNWARKVAEQGHPVLVFSMEMTRREVLWRLMSDAADLYIGKFQGGAFTENEWLRLKQVREKIRELPIAIDDQSASIQQINTAARRFVQGYGKPGLVVVDYVQRLNVPGKERPDIEVGKNIKALKSLARQLDTTVIAVCQLNRGNETRSDKRPQLSDLRESGQLEQEADAVILIHRKDYYDKEVPEAGEAEFIVAKNRHGPTDTITLASQLHYSRFQDWKLDGRNAA